MLKLLRLGTAEYGAAILVVITAVIVGHQAALGMNSIQMAGAVVSVLGSISVAVMVFAWPPKARTQKVRKD